MGQSICWSILNGTFTRLTTRWGYLDWRLAIISQSRKHWRASECHVNKTCAQLTLLDKPTPNDWAATGVWMEMGNIEAFINCSVDLSTDLLLSCRILLWGGFVEGPLVIGVIIHPLAEMISEVKAPAETPMSIIKRIVSGISVTLTL